MKRKKEERSSSPMRERPFLAADQNWSLACSPMDLALVVGLLCTARPNNSLTHWVSATVVRPRGKVGRPPMRHRLLEASIIRQYSSADCVLGDSHSQIDSALLSGNRGERERRKKKRLNVSFGDFSLLSRGKSVVVGRKQKE